MGFFGESMIQNYKLNSIQKSQYSKNIVALLYSNLPYFVGSFELFKVFARYDIDLLYNIKDKKNLFKLFIRERIKIFLNRTFARFGSVKFNLNFKSCPQWLHLIPGISGFRISVKSTIVSWMSEMSSRTFSMGKALLGLRNP